MKVNRVEAYSFAISGEAEDYFKAVVDGKITQQSKSKNLQSEIKLKYLPLMRFRAVRSKVDSKGKAHVGQENYFFIDLSSLDMYYIEERSYGAMIQKLVSTKKAPTRKIEKSGLLNTLSRLPDDIISNIGMLLDRGTTPLNSVDQNIAKFLVEHGFAKVFTPDDSIVSMLGKELSEERRPSKYYLKHNLTIPKFAVPRYDLASFLEIVNVVESDVPRESIKHTPEEVAVILQRLFNCVTAPCEIVYLPVMQCSYMFEGEIMSELYYPTCSKGNRKAIRFRNPAKLRPLMLGSKGKGRKSVPLEASSIAFKDVSGMEGVKEKIRQAIIYPLTKPELAKEYGEKAGGGIMFYGPPGCGKTFLARATVGEAKVDFFTLNVQDIIGDAPEAGAQKLHQAFKDAREHSPAILFFDEIDALGGRRESAQATAERMLINQFLTEMDGLGSTNENVLILASTNAPWDIDPALRRAGRFTQQIFIPPPDNEARKALFKAYTKERGVSEDVEFDELIQLTDGYSSADIKAICDEASKVPWEEAMKGGEKRLTSMKDFKKVLSERQSSLIPWFKLAEKQIKASGEIDVYKELAEYVLRKAGGVEQAKKQGLTFEGVGGLEEVKEQIMDKVVYPMKNPDLAKEYGKTVGGGIMFYGPPGCGKTYIARATAGECDAAFFNVKMTDLLSPEEGVTEKRIQSVFERAKYNSPAILFFDEIDAIAGVRSSAKGGVERRLVNQLLTELDGFEKREGVMIIAATNAPWDIDPALRRAGRFSDLVYVPPPDFDSRVEVFKIHTKGKPIDPQLGFLDLAELTDGYSSADISAICDDALELAWKEAQKGHEKRLVNLQDFQKVIARREPSIIPWFKLAEREIESSGEKQLYTALLEDVGRHKSGVTKPKKEAGDKAKLTPPAGMKAREMGDLLDRERMLLRKEAQLKKEEGPGGPSKKKPAPEKPDPQAERKRILERKIQILKKKHENGDVDDQVFKDMIARYEDQLIELEAESG